MSWWSWTDESREARRRRPAERSFGRGRRRWPWRPARWGNSSYAHIGRLPNPENDAVDLSAALRAFTSAERGADVSLVFYAGHSIEMDGVNYVVPVDARLERDTDVRFETVTLDDVLTLDGGSLATAIDLGRLPAHPLARSMQRTAATRSVRREFLGVRRGSAGGRDAGRRMRRRRGQRRRRTGGAGTARTRRRCWRIWRFRSRFRLLFRRVRAQVLEATSTYLDARTLPEGASVPEGAWVTVTAECRGGAGRPTAPLSVGDGCHDAGLVRWFRRAAEQGRAVHNLGDLGRRNGTGALVPGLRRRLASTGRPAEAPWGWTELRDGGSTSAYRGRLRRRRGGRAVRCSDSRRRRSTFQQYLRRSRRHA